jgi:hypothetical protein
MSARKHAKRQAANNKRARKTAARQRRKAAGKPRRASNAQSFNRLREWFLPDEGIFAGLNRHGNTSENLVWASRNRKQKD